MGAESSSNVDLEALEKALPAAVAGARSLAEIESWLKSQPSVKSVRLADYLLKSNPPQRDFILECMTGDEPATIIVNIFELGNQHFKFNKLRDK